MDKIKELVLHGAKVLQEIADDKTQDAGVRLQAAQSLVAMGANDYLSQLFAKDAE